MGSDRLFEGQMTANRQPFMSRGPPGIVSSRPLSRKEEIARAYNFLARNINSLAVQRTVEGTDVLDVAETYRLRTSRLHESYLSHHLPTGVTIKVNPQTASAQLYVNKRKYSPKN